MARTMNPLPLDENLAGQQGGPGIAAGQIVLFADLQLGQWMLIDRTFPLQVRNASQP